MQIKSLLIVEHIGLTVRKTVEIQKDQQDETWDRDSEIKTSVHDGVMIFSYLNHRPNSFLCWFSKLSQSVCRVFRSRAEAARLRGHGK